MPVLRGVWVAIVVLALAEVVSAFYFASLNPVRGYDENAYAINAFAIRGEGALPYTVHRPPLLSMVQAALGEHRWMISGFAHIAATAMLLLVLRRLVPLGFAIAGTAVFMLSGDMRLYNMVALTEMPGIFLTLLGVFLFISRRPFGLGVVAVLLVMLHWGMVSVTPAIVLAFIIQRQWPELRRFIFGAVVATVPFLILSAIAFGNPFAPVFGSLGIQRGSENDWSYYLRTFPQLPIMLIAGGVVACGWITSRLRSGKRDDLLALAVLLLGVIVMRLVVVHMYESKAERYLMPLFPALLVLSVLMLWRLGRRPIFLQVTLWVLLAASVAPNKRMLYEMYALATDPVHAVIDMRTDLARHATAGPIYTDLNDMAVMGHTGLPAVAVTGANSWHHYLSSRPATLRTHVPDDAIYLTWDPAGSDVLASAPCARGKALWLVRWRSTNAIQTASRTTTARAAQSN